MSATIMDGKRLAADIKSGIAEAVFYMERKPTLAVVLVGDDPASALYVRSKARDCADCGILCRDHHLVFPQKGHDARRGAGGVYALAVVDVSMNHDALGRLCGDTDFAAVAERAYYITPTPGDQPV